jgi:hypothetical protein
LPRISIKKKNISKYSKLASNSGEDVAINVCATNGQHVRVVIENISNISFQAIETKIA